MAEEQEQFSMVTHIGWVHYGMSGIAMPKEQIYEVMAEFISEAAAEFRVKLVELLIDNLKKQDAISDKQIAETWQALEDREWWFTIGGPDMDILQGVEIFKTPHERWLASKDQCKN